MIIEYGTLEMLSSKVKQSVENFKTNNMAFDENIYMYCYLV